MFGNTSYFISQLRKRILLEYSVFFVIVPNYLPDVLYAIIVLTVSHKTSGAIKKSYRYSTFLSHLCLIRPKLALAHNGFNGILVFLRRVLVLFE